MQTSHTITEIMEALVSAQSDTGTPMEQAAAKKSSPISPRIRTSARIPIASAWKIPEISWDVLLFGR